ncbi:MAG: hypothetical protein ACE366_03605 [Bradymonadia bacterium]
MSKYTKWMLFTALAPLVACGGGGGGGSDAPAYEITLSSTPPIDVEISRVAIEIPEGVVVRVQAIDEEGEAVGLEPDDPGILDAEPTQTPGEIVFIAVQPGETCVNVIFQGGGSAPCIPAEVVAQP